MMNILHRSAAPHIHSGTGTSNIMLDVVIALVPATVAAVILFGLKALYLVLVCVIAAVASEFVFNLCSKRKQTVGDFSAVVTGLLLALNLSTAVELWQAALGSVFAIIVVKCFFGGLGKNIVNPAIAARVFMLLTFGSVGMATTTSPLFDLGFLKNAVPAPEIVSGATPLAALNTGVEGLESAPSLLQLAVGAHGGTIGETCAIALIIGFIYLVCRKVIKWYVPVSYVATVFVCYLVSGGFNFTYAASHVLAGGLLIGAIFMATDYVTTPTSGLGRVVFCVGAGLLTFVLREFSSYPEGVSIAILTMNLLTPFISEWTQKRTLGGVK